LTNYFLLLYPFVGERAEELGWEERPVAVLWFFDSLGGGAYQRQYWETQEGDGDNWVNSQVVVVSAASFHYWVSKFFFLKVISASYLEGYPFLCRRESN